MTRAELFALPPWPPTAGVLWDMRFVKHALKTRDDAEALAFLDRYGVPLYHVPAMLHVGPVCAQDAGQAALIAHFGIAARRAPDGPN